MTSRVQLGRYDNRWFRPGRSLAWRALWMFVGQPLLRTVWLPSSRWRVALLRAFGARIGERVVVHSEVVVKYPWHLTVGDDCWIGERVWIDCLTTVRLATNVCLSQGVYLCTGNHDWSDPAFGLRVEPIQIGDGAWAGARSTLLPGTCLGDGAVLAAGSVLGGTVPPFEVWRGNPAAFARRRTLRQATSAESTTDESARAASASVASANAEPTVCEVAR